jgi:hypothetical protein
LNFSATIRAISLCVGGFCCFVALAACGGGGGGGSTAPAVPNGTTVPVTANLTVTIPNRTAQSTRRALYISPSVQSIEVQIQYATSTTIGAQVDVNAGSSACSVVSGGRECTISLIAQPGALNFIVTLYDQTGETGNVLAVSTTPVPPASGSNAVVNLSVSMQGVAGSVALALGGTLYAGTPGTVPVIVTASDADGNPIGGTAPYASPVMLGTVGTGLTLSTTSVAAPTTPVTVTYDGSAGSPMITAQTSSIPAVTLPVLSSPAPGGSPAPTPTPTPAPGVLTLGGVPTGNSLTSSFTLTATIASYSGPIAVTATNATVTPAQANGPNASFAVAATPGVVSLTVSGDGQQQTATYDLFGPLTVSPSSLSLTVGSSVGELSVSQAGTSGTLAVASACQGSSQISVTPATIPVGTSGSVTVTPLQADPAAPTPACTITVTGPAGSVTVNVNVNQNNVIISNRERAK